tara:strand:+ start:717 stop:1190 length:474 start_codon:yes stop_codon:yes gene_type:complete
MKKTFLILLLLTISLPVLSQTYKLESVYSDMQNYLSYWKPLENTPNSGEEEFSLWGYQEYFDDAVNGMYEVQYFKGNTQEIFNFLQGIVDFTKKYEDQDNTLTYINRVKIKTLKKLGIKRTLVFDPEGKVAIPFNGKQWEKILEDLIDYCNENGISI